jgi:hypothetical protein
MQRLLLDLEFPEIQHLQRQTWNIFISNLTQRRLAMLVCVFGSLGTISSVLVLLRATVFASWIPPQLGSSWLLVVSLLLENCPQKFLAG